MQLRLSLVVPNFVICVVLRACLVTRLDTRMAELERLARWCMKRQRFVLGNVMCSNAVEVEILPCRKGIEQCVNFHYNKSSFRKDMLDHW